MKVDAATMVVLAMLASVIVLGSLTLNLVLNYGTLRADNSLTSPCNGADCADGLAGQYETGLGLVEGAATILILMAAFNIYRDYDSKTLTTNWQWWSRVLAIASGAALIGMNLTMQFDISRLLNDGSLETSTPDAAGNYQLEGAYGRGLLAVGAVAVATAGADMVSTTLTLMK